MKSKLLSLLLVFTLVTVFLPWQAVLGQGSPLPQDSAGFQSSESGELYPLMHLSAEQLAQMNKHLKNAPRAVNDLEISGMLEFHQADTSANLLPHLQYIPHERDQGRIGNCWVWAGTGMLEIALNVQMDIKDRLSIQYFNSNYNGGRGPSWAGNGGWLEYLVYFYNNNGRAVPWSNTNAEYQDYHADQNNPQGSSVLPYEIGSLPNYPVYAIEEQVIETTGVDNVTAINNIKNALLQHKAVWFSFFMPELEDWYAFSDFWRNQDETAVWSPNYSVGDPWDDGAGHAVLCVGYNDEPGNSYWIMLNSWGNSANRPNGLFRVDMNDFEYSGVYYDGEESYYSFSFETLDVDFPSTPTTVTAGRASSINTTSAVLTGRLPQVTTSEPARVAFEYGLTPACGSATPWQTQSTTRDFSSKLTGLTPGTTYYYRARAYDLYSGSDPGYSAVSSFTTQSSSPRPKPIPRR